VAAKAAREAGERRAAASKDKNEAKKEKGWSDLTAGAGATSNPLKASLSKNQNWRKQQLKNTTGSKKPVTAAAGRAWLTFARNIIPRICQPSALN